MEEAFFVKVVRLVLHSDVCAMTEEYILTDILIMSSCDVYIGGVRYSCNAIL